MRTFCRRDRIPSLNINPELTAKPGVNGSPLDFSQSQIQRIKNIDDDGSMSGSSHRFAGVVEQADPAFRPGTVLSHSTSAPPPRIAGSRSNIVFSVPRHRNEAPPRAVDFRDKKALAKRAKNLSFKTMFACQGTVRILLEDQIKASAFSVVKMGFILLIAAI